MFISVLVSCVNVITLKNVHLKCFQVSLCHFCRAESQTGRRVAASALGYVSVFVWLDGWNTPECNGTPVRVTCGYLEDARHHRVMPPWPHLLDDVGVGLGDLSLHSQRVGEVQLIHIGVLQEVLRQGRGVTQTLQRDEDTRSYYTSVSDGQPIRTELA